MIKRVKNVMLLPYVISDLNAEEIAGTFYKKEFQQNKSKRI